MRAAFLKELETIASGDKNVYLLTANLGFKLFDEFRSRYPKQFIDVGVAESNMIGIAAGLSLSGKNVYCYSIIPFLIMRAYEQLRIDIAYHKLNVKLIGVGSGFTYGFEGFTHYGIEDVSLMRSLPNMNIVIPADIKEAKHLARISVDFPSPLYIRLGRTADQLVHESEPEFEIGRGIFLTKGKDVAIIASGSMVYQAKIAADLLKKHSLSVTLLDMHTIKPLDIDSIKQCAASCKAIFSVEEHSINGGLGSAVAEVLSECSYGGLFQRIGIPDKLPDIIGQADFLRGKCGLTAEGIRQTVLNKLKEG